MGRIAWEERAEGILVPSARVAGAVNVVLSEAAAPLTARWFNPRDGQAGEPFFVPADKPGTFQSPDGQDWVLQLRETSRW